MTRDELRERVLAHFEACGPDSDAAADGAIAIVGEACAEIAAGYDWLGERRAAGIGRTGSGVDEGAYAVACDHAATEIAQRILALTSEKPNA